MSLLDTKDYEKDNDDRGVNPLFEKMEGIHKRWLKDWKPLREVKAKRWWRLWNVRTDPSMFGPDVDEDMLENHMMLPTAFQQVEASAGRINKGLDGSWPFFQLKPIIGYEDLEFQSRLKEHAKKYRAFLLTQLHEHIGLRKNQNQLMWIRESETFGIVWLFLYWLTKKGPVGVLEPEVASGDPKNGKIATMTGRHKYSVKEDEIQEDHIACMPHSFWDILPDPHGRSVNGEDGTQPCRAIQRTMILAVDEFWAFVQGTSSKGWKLPGKMEDIEKYCGKFEAEDDVAHTMMAEMGQLSASHGTGWHAQNKEDRRLLRVVETWEQDRMTCHIGGKGEGLVALCQIGKDYPYHGIGIPMVNFRTSPVLNQLYGKSLIEPIEEGVHRSSVLVALRGTALERAISPTTLVNNALGLYANQLYTQQNNVVNIEVGPLEDCMHQVETQDPTERAWQEVEWELGQAQLTTGLSDFSIGGQAETMNRTARGIQSQMQGGAIRTDAKVAAAAAHIVTLMRMVHKFNKANLGEKPARVIEVVGDDGVADWVALTGEMMAHEYDMKFDTLPQSVDENMDKTNWVQALQALVPFAPVLDAREIALETLRILKRPDPQRFIMKPGGVPELENQIFMTSANHDFPNVRPTDNHDHHLDVLALITPEIAARFGPMAVQNVEKHKRSHLGYMGVGGPPQGAPQPQIPGAPPAQLPPPQGGPGGPTGPAGQAGPPMMGGPPRG